MGLLRDVRLFLVAGGVAWLAGCASVPPGAAPTPGAAPAVAPPTTPKPVAKPAPPPSSFPVERDSVPSAPVAPAAPDDRPAAELLGGELAREFQRGHASWYGPRFHGRRTASGERFDMLGLTAAHRTLPFGTLVRVRSLVNGKEVEVRINDRGPYSGDRIIDVSRAAAEELGMLGLGFKQVVLLVPESTPELVETPPTPPRQRARPVRRAAPGKKR